MIDFAAHLSGPKLTADIARSALPDAPVVPAPVAGGAPTTAVLLRQRVSLTLRRLADLVEPPPAKRIPVAACR